MTTSALVVPIQCEALAATPALIARDGFRRWRFNYSSLGDFRSPEAAAFDGNTGTALPGVYLHWDLPAALRHGGRDEANPNTPIGYELVPNRWLVVRAAGDPQRQLTAWVVESDAPYRDNAGADVGECSTYLVDDGILALWKASADPGRQQYTPIAAQTYTPPFGAPGPGDEVQEAMIGMPFALQGWTEQAAKAMFLTAVAPGNPNFSGYYAHHSGVFGFRDGLQGVDDGHLAYYVVGWYSDPDQDVGAKWLAAGKLAAHGWTLAKPGDPAPRSLYAGACLHVAWTGSVGTAPSPDPLVDANAINVAVGNTAIDAFTTLVSQQVTDVDTATLLRAFNYDLLPVLGQVNGAALLDRRVRQEWFGSGPGGRRWAIVQDDSAGGPDVALTPAEAAWLAQLNADQATLEAAVDDMQSKQWELNALWFKLGFVADTDNDPPASPTAAELKAQLDPAADSQAKALVAAVQAVQAALGKVPFPAQGGDVTRQAAFQTAVNTFATKQGIGAGKRLKAVPQAPYWHAREPVVMLSGLDSAYAKAPDATLGVRLSGDLVTGFNVGGKPVSRATAGSGMPSLNLGALPDGVAAALDELFLLDEDNAAGLAAAAGLNVADVQAAMANAASYAGIMPDLDRGAWQQPWQPLFLEWKGGYMPIPESSNGQPNWTFDGEDYRFMGSYTLPASAVPTTVSGRSLLSPHAQYVFGSRLSKFLAEVPDQATISHLYDELSKVYQWKFLAQELSGFNQALSLRDGRTFRRPSPGEQIGSGASAQRLADLLGYDDGAIAGPTALPRALRGHVTSVPLIPYDDTAPPPFSGTRQGQFYFTDLLLYDRFGRARQLIGEDSSGGADFHTFPVWIDGDFAPAHRLTGDAIRSVFELPPRLLQPGRLGFDLIDRADDGLVYDGVSAACPVCAWLVPNHLDASVLLFDAQGQGLGEVRVTAGLDGQANAASWGPTPGSVVASLDELAKASPHLYALVTTPAFLQEDNFYAFLGAIDESLWTIDVLGQRADQDLSVLVGRPLALVRARLRVELQGAPIRDTGWAATFDKTPPAFLSQRFAVRLGDQATRQDGVIGYFTGNDYAHFNSVAAPFVGDAQTLVAQIGPPGAPNGNYLAVSPGDEQGVFVSVLLDPRATAHATSGVFPVKTLKLPDGLVQGPLSAMAMTFRVGPLMTAMQPSPAQGGAKPAFASSIAFPRLAEQAGAWSWWEPKGDGTYDGYGLVPSTTTPRLASPQPSLREGFLRFQPSAQPQA